MFRGFGDSQDLDRQADKVAEIEISQALPFRFVAGKQVGQLPEPRDRALPELVVTGTDPLELVHGDQVRLHQGDEGQDLELKAAFGQDFPESGK